MEKVTIDGIDYIRASVLAKSFKYTTDYIGQLCRARKVDARLVGRTWYVSPESLQSHKHTRYAELRSDEKIEDKPIKERISRIDVEAPPSKKIFKATAFKEKKNFINHILWKPAEYERDTSALLPAVDKTEVQRTTQSKLPVELAEAEKVSVVEASAPVQMKSEPLPAIVLGGTLKIRSMEEQFENTIENPSDIVTVHDVKDVLSGEGEEGEMVAVVSHKQSLEPEVARASAPKVRPKFAEKLLQHDVASGDMSAVPIGPVDHTLVVPVTSLEAEREERVPIFFLATAAVALFVLFVGLSLIESVTRVDQGAVETSLNFQLPSLNFLASTYEADL